LLDNVFEGIYLAGFVAGSVIRGVYTRGCRRNRIALDRKAGPDTVLVILSSIGLFGLPFTYILTSWLDFADYGPPAWTGWVGATVFIAALWLLWRSHVDLGRNWSAVPRIREGHSLVIEGVYRHIRHPMYAAHWLWGVAQLLLLWNWLAGPALLVFFLPVYFVRVPREEQMMLDRFGEDYRAYMGRTGRLIPRFRR